MLNNGDARRGGDSVATRKKSIMGGRWVGLPAFVLAPMVLIATPHAASAASTVCLQNADGTQRDIAGNWSTPDKTRSVITQQARNTWEDWIWRGETYKCDWNVPKCGYQWQKSKTTGWQWSVGLDIKVPIPGAKDLASITPSYGRSSSTTTSFTFQVDLKPGQKAQPIQVVERRWTKGDFRGIYHSTGKSCLPSPTRPDGKAYEYRWDPNKRWGSWTTNLAVNSYASYHVWG